METKKDEWQTIEPGIWKPENQQANLFKVEVAKGGPDSEPSDAATVAVKVETAPKGASSAILHEAPPAPGRW